MTTGWLHTSCIFAPTRRPMMSVAPPGGKGTINRTARVGKVCALAESGTSARQSSRLAARRFAIADLEIGNAARCDGIVAVELFEIEGRAPALLPGDAVPGEEVELAWDVAKPLGVEPQPHEAPLPLRLGETREAGSRVHHGVVVDDDHVAALEEERE